MAFAVSGNGKQTTYIPGVNFTTVSYTTGEIIASGVLVVICIMSDNTSSGTDGDNGEVVSIIDALSNTYTKAVEWTNVRGGADTGATASIWYCVLTTGITATTSATITFSTTRNDKLVVGHRSFTFSGGVITVAGSQGKSDTASDAGAITISGLNSSSEYLFIRASAVENNTSAGTVSTNFTQLVVGTSASGTTGGGAASNIWGQAEYRIVTATSETSDPTTASVDNASAMAAFYAGIYVPANSSKDPMGMMGFFGT